MTQYLLSNVTPTGRTIEPADPSSAVGGHSGGSERASMLVNAIRWFRNG